MHVKHKDELLADLAETYRVYSLSQLPMTSVARLAVQLPPNSRVKLRMAGMTAPLDTLLLAKISDTLALLWWAKSKDAQHNRNRPQSLTAVMLDKHNTAGDVQAFDSPAAYERVRAASLGKVRQEGADHGN
ncbi:MAG: DUF5361 domain-containing protein [Oscillospiraceae bacterium]|nr:DUF5361 domain-containing protein [Oscillospiraceae bacterium]